MFIFLVWIKSMCWTFSDVWLVAHISSSCPHKAMVLDRYFITQIRFCFHLDCPLRTKMHHKMNCQLPAEVIQCWLQHTRALVGVKQPEGMGRPRDLGDRAGECRKRGLTWGLLAAGEWRMIPQTRHEGLEPIQPHQKKKNSVILAGLFTHMYLTLNSNETAKKMKMSSVA